MFEVCWSERGHKPDHKPHIFHDYDEAVKFLTDEVEWQDVGMSDSGSFGNDSLKALHDLRSAQDNQEFNFRIGRYVFWLVKVGGVIR